MEKGVILTKNERIKLLERENKKLIKENADYKSVVDYIAACDYPEVFEEEDTNGENL